MTLKASRVGGANPLLLGEVLCNLVLVSGLQGVQNRMTCTKQRWMKHETFRRFCAITDTECFCNRQNRLLVIIRFSYETSYERKTNRAYKKCARKNTHHGAKHFKRFPLANKRHRSGIVRPLDVETINELDRTASSAHLFTDYTIKRICFSIYLCSVGASVSGRLCRWRWCRAETERGPRVWCSAKGTPRRRNRWTLLRRGPWPWTVSWRTRGGTDPWKRRCGRNKLAITTEYRYQTVHSQFEAFVEQRVQRFLLDVGVLFRAVREHGLRQQFDDDERIAETCRRSVNKSQ